MVYDLVLVGGGLQNALVALAVLRRRPDARIALVERGASLGGNHTWCFHAADIPRDFGEVVEPLIAYRWDGYDVAFPGLERVISAPYAAVTSERLDRVVRARLRAAPGARLYMGADAAVVEPSRVGLADRTALIGGLVVDARGPRAGVAGNGRSGYQKFVGVEVELERPHGLERPVLMDATVPQFDGFRFVYLLPFGARRVLIEDTYFSDTPVLDRDAIAHEALAYAERRGWRVARVVREEHGVLPLPWAGDVVEPEHGLVVGGYAGGWFHPVTGYSFPAAARLARHVADPDADLAALARRHRKQLRFVFRLNKMLFNWFAPEDRWRVLERFYRLPEGTIRRFYAMELTAGDRARILLGRPPRGLSLRRALGGSR